MAIKTPSAATFLKLNGIFFLMVSISNAKNKSVIPECYTQSTDETTSRIMMASVIKVDGKSKDDDSCHFCNSM